MLKRVAQITSIASFVALASISCDDGGGGTTDPPFESPYDAVAETERIEGEGLSAPVDVVRDEYGIPHIYATTISDLAYANGYVMAQDRLPQMNLFRHAASGTLSKIFGALQPSVVDDDIRMRMHRLRPIAEESLAALRASSDPIDQEIVLYFDRFADGVNAYAAELAQGKRTLDDAITVFFPADKFEEWTALDSLTIGRLQAFALSYDDYDIRVSRAVAAATMAFPADDADPDLARRALAGFDIMQIKPMSATAPIPGFPNVDADTGTRAKPGAAAKDAPATAARPWLEPDLLDRALKNARPQSFAGLPVVDRQYSSNNWIVGPKKAGAGTAILANDTHLPLINPSIWYMVHLTVPGVLDVEGVGFPGLPALQLGHNDKLAWGATVIVHDVYDFYAEEIVPCAAGGGDCVVFEGGEVPIETWTEEIEIGANGTVVETRQLTYESVPHHGPLIPDVAGGQIIPRTGNSAISAKFTGHQATNEVRAVFRMLKAKDVAEGMDALDDWNYGGMNWVLADSTGAIAYTGSARIPTRSPGCFTFDRTTPSGRQGVAPFMVVPGDGSCEWTGFMSDRYMPHAINPEVGYLGTANSDPVGETFDGNPLNGPMVDGSPLYLGSFYDPGFRTSRIYDRLDALPDGTTTAEDLMSIQADTYSNLGSALTPQIVARVAAAKAGTGGPADAAAFYAGLSPEKQARLDAAVTRLDAWTFETPPAAYGSPDAATIADSSATVLFNLWGVYFFNDAYGDELALVGEYVEQNLIARAGMFLLTDPGSFLTGLDPGTGEPVLCDDLGTDGVIESCSLIVVRALDKALDKAEATFASADATTWRWGKLHRLTLNSQLPDDQLDVPPPTEANPDWIGGYPRHGDTYSVDSSDAGWTDFDFTYGHGPAMRHITTFAPGAPPKTMFALPGGITFDRSSPHYRDLMEEYWVVNEYFELPWLAETVVAKAEGRVRFVPKK